tara:strand:- start:809 stop:2179 length:1371 start_codon:yes stop_codon:yes gene_type:complete
MNNLTKKNIIKFSKKFNKKRTNKVFKNVNTKNHFNNLVIKSDYLQKNNKYFSNMIDINTSITDQKNSGRCWIFAFLNIIRLEMIKKYNLPDFRFSENYLAFYDKLEKANFFLSYIINNYKKKLDDIKLINILKIPICDGGTWNIFVNLVNKYGLIPNNVMQEQYHSGNTIELNKFLNTFLRKTAITIRNYDINYLRENKDKILENFLYECYKILVIFYGEPPKKFDWNYITINNKNKNLNYKENKKNNIVRDLDAITFYKKYVPYNVNNKICLINYPCPDKKFYNLYNTEQNTNVLNMRLQNYINVPIDIMLKSVIKSIDNNEGVWTGLYWNKYNIKERNILDKNAFNYKDVFGYDNDIEKCNGLKYRDSFVSHAVVIRGYNKDNNGKIDKFLVENSHGKNNHEKNNNYIMNIDWFNDLVYEVVVDKKYVSKKILNVLKKKPILLPYNDPFGNLAL